MVPLHECCGSPTPFETTIIPVEALTNPFKDLAYTSEVLNTPETRIIPYWGPPTLPAMATRIPVRQKAPKMHFSSKASESEFIFLSYHIKGSYLEYQKLQVYSYYKMISWFCVPQPSLEGTTGPNWLKLGVNSRFSRGVFAFSVWGPRYGVPKGSRVGGQKFWKIFIRFFHFFQREWVLEALNRSYMWK